jgi:hypothetical protein
LNCTRISISGCLSGVDSGNFDISVVSSTRSMIASLLAVSSRRLSVIVSLIVTISLVLVLPVVSVLIAFMMPVDISILPVSILGIIFSVSVFQLHSSILPVSIIGNISPVEVGKKFSDVLFPVEKFSLELDEFSVPENTIMDQLSLVSISFA